MNEQIQQTITPNRDLMAQKDAKGRFLPGHTLGFKKGQSGNPGGGSLSQKIRHQIFSTFDAGEFNEWRVKHKTEYYKLLFSLMPKELKGEGFSGQTIVIQDMSGLMNPQNR